MKVGDQVSLGQDRVYDGQDKDRVEIGDFVSENGRKSVRWARGRKYSSREVETQALSQATGRSRAGNIVAISGPSGCGK